MDKNSLIGRTMDDYTILKVLGQGGFATIYLAENNETKKKVVIKLAKSHYLYRGYISSTLFFTPKAKLIDPGATDGPAEVKANPWDINELLEREGEALESISHPSWVKVLGKGAYYGIFYLILEYINGKTLHEKIKAKDNILLQYLIDIIDALIAAKEDGLDYHGDLKPSNIIIKNDASIKMIDPSSFGLKQKANTDIIVTTPLYNPFLTRNDINSLGIILYEIATGFLPFTPSIAAPISEEAIVSEFISPRYLNPALPERLNEIILKALHIKVDGDKIVRSEKGYDSLAEIKEDLEKLVSETGLSYLQVPSTNKTDAIMRALSPYLQETGQIPWVRKVLNRIINYPVGDITIISSRIISSRITEPIMSQKALPASQKEDFRSGSQVKAGDLLFDRYEIKAIKRGDLGIVYTALDVEDKEPVVIRTIPEQLWADSKVPESFKKAYNLWLSLPKHKNIVSAYSMNETEGRPYLFLEYIDGTDLGQLIRTKSLALDRVLDIAIQACDGMDYIFKEKRVIHRNIKPGRILISKGGAVKITGFELAFVADELEDTARRSICGTLPYMSPEHFTAPEEVDNRSDIYSFGCVLYEMVTGNPPFRPDFALSESRILTFQKSHLEVFPPPPHKVNPDIPKPLGEIILKCLSKSPVGRFQSFIELREALRAISEYLT